MQRGAWIAERTGSVWDERLRRPDPALGDQVPSGFEALIRVLHPFGRDRPVGGSWADYRRVEAGCEASGEWGELPGIRSEAVTWKAAAAAHGAEMRPDAPAFRLLGFERYGEQPDGTEINPDGWRYELPREGSLEPGPLSALARILAGRTETPDRGIAAVWEGYGGLVSAQGVAYFGWPEEPRVRLPAWAERLRARWWNRRLDFHERRRHFGLGAALRARFLPGVQQPAGSGLLSEEAATGPRLELPDRAYVCFEAGIRDFVDEGWRERAPWIDESSPFDYQSPNLIWPEDRAWFLISEIDFDSTLIACSRECADGLLAAGSSGGTAGPLAVPGFEAVEIARDTCLWEAG